MSQSTFLYPSNAELREIAQDKIANLTMDDPLFNIFPIRETQAPIVMWEQMDNYTGLQQLRGLGGDPPRVKKTGGKRYQMEPGYYGEFELLDELEMTLRRPYGQWSGGVDVGDLVMRAQDKLLGRRLDRIKKIGWDLLSAGTFSVSLPTGGTGHTDTFPLQTFTASVAWSTGATSTPLADFRAIRLKHRGHSVRFDSSSIAFMNQVTFNYLMSNTNASDIAGRRTQGLNTLLALNKEEFNRVLLGEDLPQIVVYDEGYLDDNGTFQPFIPNSKVVIVGRRTDGVPIAHYQMTLNVNNPDMGAGAYMKVIDRAELTVPRTVEVHDGHNGGPAIEFPSAVVLASV